MSINIEAERKLFEKWYSNDGLFPSCIERTVDEYKLMGASLSWIAWQARAAMQTQPQPHVSCDLRLDAYYYGFTETGVPAIDRILSAVACAGKAFHSTDCWAESASAYKGHVGDSPVDWIQNAADDAAKVAPPSPPPLTDEPAALKTADIVSTSLDFGISGSTAEIVKFARAIIAQSRGEK